MMLTRARSRCCTYVSTNLAKARLLIVGTYRDVEVDRNHPLSAALAELRRSSSFGRVLLRGLNADEVSRMLKSITHDDVPLGSGRGDSQARPRAIRSLSRKWSAT